MNPLTKSRYSSNQISNVYRRFSKIYHWIVRILTTTWISYRDAIGNHVHINIHYEWQMIYSCCQTKLSCIKEIVSIYILLSHYITSPCSNQKKYHKIKKVAFPTVSRSDGESTFRYFRVEKEIVDAYQLIVQKTQTRYWALCS